MLVITDFASSDAEIAQRNGIILTARVHPGEAQSSYVMEGVIDFLVSKN